MDQKMGRTKVQYMHLQLAPAMYPAKVAVKCSETRYRDALAMEDCSARVGDLGPAARLLGAWPLQLAGQTERWAT
jgi:hypothetical protein